MPLDFYMQHVQRLIGFDEHQSLYNPDDLRDFINIARSEVAAQGQCVRDLTANSGSVVKLQITTPGSLYTAPVLTITPPDQPNGALPYPLGQQAVGLAQQIGGQLSDASVSVGGFGYYAPAVTISDATGSGAVVTAITNRVTTTTPGQELYRFSEIDLSGVPGVQSILAVLGVSFVWGNWQWSVSPCSISKYQAVVRQFTTNFLAPPVWAAQLGQGAAGSLKLYPIADTNYPMQWDCVFLPTPLLTDEDYDAIPAPWTNAVPYYAAHLALLSRAAQVPQLLPLAMQYYNEKNGGLFYAMMRRARVFSQPGRVSSFYGRV